MALQLVPSPEHSPLHPFSFDTPSSGSPFNDLEFPLNPTSPVTTFLDDKEFKIHGQAPLAVPPTVIRCPDCKKPVIRSAIEEHAENCRNIASGLYASPPPSDGLLPQASNGLLANGNGPHKRRASEASLSDAPSLPSPKRPKEEDLMVDSRLGAVNGKKTDQDKKEREKMERKNAKAHKEKERQRKREAKSGPLNLDDHCGAINSKGVPCSRSLTCKSHTVGAKREVQGRSRPFDELLLDYQRTHNPNFVEPSKRVGGRKKRDREDEDGGPSLRDGDRPKKKKKSKKDASAWDHEPDSIEGFEAESETFNELLHSCQRAHGRLLLTPAFTVMGNKFYSPFSPFYKPSTFSLAIPNSSATMGPRGLLEGGNVPWLGMLTPKEEDKSILYKTRRDEAKLVGDLLSRALGGPRSTLNIRPS